MAIQILPEEGSLGGSLGTAVGGGINSLIEKKLNDLHKTQAVNERKATYKKAQLPEWLAELPEDMQTLLLKEYDLAPEPEKQAMKQELDQMTQEFHQPDEDVEDGSLPAQLQQSPHNTQAGQMEQAERSTIPGMNTLQQEGQSQRSSQGQSSPVQAFPQEGRGTKGAPSLAMQQNFESPALPAERIQDPQQPVSSNKEIERPRGLQRKGAAGSSAPTRKEAAAEQKAIDTATKPTYDRIVKDNTKAVKDRQTLRRMSHLVEKGRLPFSAFYSSLKGLEEHITPQVGVGVGAAVGGVLGGALGLAGGPLAVPAGVAGAAVGSAIGSGLGAVINPIVSTLRNIERQIFPDTEEFEKLSQSFIAGAKDIFGARIAVEEMKAYMLTIPTLANTDRGKKAIIRDMDIVAEAAEVKYKASQKVIKNNGGHRPIDYDAQVEALAAKELDKLAEEFISGEKKTLQKPKEENVPRSNNQSNESKKKPQIIDSLRF